MMKRIVFLLVFTICCFACNRNNRVHEAVKTEGLPKEEAKSLIALGQLWGFLKYHHPSVAEGKYDWDRELIKRIHSIRNAKNEVQWKKLLDNWLDSLPPIEAIENKKLPDLEVKTKPDYGVLLDTAYFYPQTVDKIKYILEHAVVSSNYYINIKNGVISTTNESAYKEMLYPDSSYRLLALFKHWNFVNYFFPYRELCDQTWSSVLEEMLPEFINAADREQYATTCLKLLTKIDDSHGFFATNDHILKSKFGLRKVPFETQFVENKLVVTAFTGGDPYIKENIKLGDIITAIDGEPVEEVVLRMLPYAPASNYAVKLRSILAMILRGNTTTVSLKAQRDNKSFDLKVPYYDRDSLKIPNNFTPRPEEKGYQILKNNIGYVLPSSCKIEDRDEGIRKVLNGTKGIIIDMRCYPGDYISLSFLDHLGNSSKNFSLVSFANVSYPGYFFIINKRDDPNEKVFSKYYKKIVVIVNEYTQSQAEDNVLGFQLYPYTTVIGSTTAGADGAVTSINLPGGMTMFMTGIGVYNPDGTDLQRKGVKIDEVIRPTIAGIKAGRDELLERAIEIIEDSSKK